jgi:hypothetical protein
MTIASSRVTQPYFSSQTNVRRILLLSFASRVEDPKSQEARLCGAASQPKGLMPRSRKTLVFVLPWLMFPRTQLCELGVAPLFVWHSSGAIWAQFFLPAQAGPGYLIRYNTTTLWLVQERGETARLLPFPLCPSLITYVA